MRIYRSVLVALSFATGLAAPGSAAISLSSTILVPTYWVVNQYLAVPVVVTNTGAAGVTLGALSFSVPAGGNFASVTYDGRGGQHLAASESITLTAYVFGNTAGTYRFAWNVPVTEDGTGATGSTYSDVTVQMDSGSAAYQHGKPVAMGKMEIRNNFIRRLNGNTNAGAPAAALIILRGAPGGTVKLAVFSASGRGMGEPERMYQVNSGVSVDTDGGSIILDSNGVATLSWQGDLGEGGFLESGVYWVAASGAVNDRKPVVILSERMN